QLISRCKPFIQRDAFLVVHAGLLPEQLYQDPLHIQERNFFLRPEQMELRRRYLDRYIVVAGHTYLGDSPTFTEGYVNIDLGAGYGKRLGAFCLEERTVIRSDGALFKYNQSI
ncbi:hypothetical protein KKA13_03270, partial [Patescibacteria group bacterium]|nr:hypothetical protein [Patescibacteria group bacterium]